MAVDFFSRYLKLQGCRHQLDRKLGLTAQGII